MNLFEVSFAKKTDNYVKNVIGRSKSEITNEAKNK